MCGSDKKENETRPQKSFLQNEQKNNIYLTDFSGGGVQCSTGLPDRILLASFDTMSRLARLFLTSQIPLVPKFNEQQPELARPEIGLNIQTEGVSN